MRELREFTYPRRLERGQIRLLVIESNTRGCIRTRLKTVRLEDAIYSALSYQWGPIEPTRQIFVNGASFRIREDLWNFLNAAHAYHHADPSCAFWTDAICINQQDTVEKSQQVQLMGKIYENAVRVLVWLGLSATDSEALIRLYDILDGDYPHVDSTEFKRAMDSAATESEAVESQAASLNFATDIWYTQTSLGGKCLVARNQWKSVLDRNPQILSALTAVASSSYWTRAWILQEVFLGQRRVIPCPGRLVDLQPILAILGHVHAYSVLEETSANLVTTKTASYKDIHQHFMERATIHTQPTRAKQKAYIDSIQHARLWNGYRVPLESLLSIPSDQTKSYSAFNKALELSLKRECGTIKDRIYSVVAFAGSDDGFPVDCDDGPGRVFAKVVIFAWQLLKVNNIENAPDSTLVDYLEASVRRAFETLDLRPPPRHSILQLEDLLSHSQSSNTRLREKVDWYQRTIGVNGEVELGIIARPPCSNIIVIWPVRECFGAYSLDTLRRHILPASGAARVLTSDDQMMLDIFE